MKYKTLFRLMLKAVGVLLLVQGLVASLNHLLPYVLLLFFGPAGGGLFLGMGDGGIGTLTVSLAVPPLCQAIAGLYLFLGGEWLVNKAIPSNKPYCHECGYDLSRAASSRCPECDTPFRPEDVEPPRVGP